MTNAFDVYFYQLINQDLSSNYLDAFMYRLSDMYTWIPLYAVFIFFAVKEFGKKSVFILLFLVFSVACSDRFTSGWMKPFFGRVRPCHELYLTPRIPEGIHCSDTGSMASSHAANHFAFAVFVVLLYGVKKRKNLVFWFAWASLIAYSRVYNGVHYPTDVLVGATVGLIFGVLSFYFYQLTLKKLKWN